MKNTYGYGKKIENWVPVMHLCCINYLKTFFTQHCCSITHKFWKYQSPKQLLTWYTSWYAKKYWKCLLIYLILFCFPCFQLLLDSWPTWILDGDSWEQIVFSLASQGWQYCSLRETLPALFPPFCWWALSAYGSAIVMSAVNHIYFS